MNKTHRVSNFQNSPISDILPEEILQYIFNKLLIGDLKKINCLNSKLHQVIYNTKLYTNVKISNYEKLILLSDSIILDKRLQNSVKEIEFDIASLEKEYERKLKFATNRKNNNECSSTKIYDRFWNNSYDFFTEDLEINQNSIYTLRGKRSVENSVSSISLATFASYPSTASLLADTNISCLNIFELLQTPEMELEEPSVLIDRILSTLNRDKLKHVSLQNITRNFRFPYTHSSVKLKTRNQLTKISLSCLPNESIDLILDYLISNTMISGLEGSSLSKRNIELYLKNYSIDLDSAQVRNPLLKKFLKLEIRKLILNNCRLIIFLQSQNFFSLIPNLENLMLVNITNIFTFLFVLDNLCNSNYNHRYLKHLSIDFASSIFHDRMTEIYDFYGPIQNYDDNDENGNAILPRNSNSLNYQLDSYFLSTYQNSFQARFHKLFLISRSHNLERIDLLNVRFINKLIIPSAESINLQEFNLFLFLSTIKNLKIINIHIDDSIKISDYPDDWNQVLFPITKCKSDVEKKESAVTVFSGNKRIFFYKK